MPRCWQSPFNIRENFFYSMANLHLAQFVLIYHFVRKNGRRDGHASSPSQSLPRSSHLSLSSGRRRRWVDDTWYILFISFTFSFSLFPLNPLLTPLEAHPGPSYPFWGTSESLLEIGAMENENQQFILVYPSIRPSILIFENVYIPLYVCQPIPSPKGREGWRGHRGY